jgi:capsular exopolysaccharide synthesis family protein
LKNLIAFKNPKSRAAEAFRTLRTNIQYSSLDNTIKSLVVTSTGPNEGKSTIVSNLAITMAQSGKKVIVVDCDLRKPTVHKSFEISNTSGLTNVLVQDKKIEECIVTTKITNLYALSSGPTPPNPAELLGSKKLKHILNELSKVFDLVILDAPPVIAVTDAQILSTIVEGVLLVSSYGQTEKLGLLKSKELLDKVGAKILGVVMNKVPEKSESYYYGRYYGTYYYENDENNEQR